MGRKFYASISVVVLLFFVVPLVVHDTFYLRVITEAIMWIGLAVTWDVLAGYTGYLNFGHGAFFGIGAYTTAILMVHKGWPFFAASIAGGAMAGLGALIAGIPTLRLRGAYFAIATWALARAIQQLALILDITGGPDGMRLPPFLQPGFFFYVMGGTVLIIFIVFWYLFEVDPFGLKVKAIRENEDGAMAMGLNPARIKIKVFIISAVPTGIIGGIYAYWITYIDPSSTLGDLVTDQAVVMAVFGGLGTLIGPAIGALIISTFKTYFWAYLSDYQVLYLIILGGLIALSVVFMPDGLWGTVYGKIQNARLAGSKEKR